MHPQLVSASVRRASCRSNVHPILFNDNKDNFFLIQLSSRVLLLWFQSFFYTGMIMQWLLVLLTLTVAACQENFVFPDEFEAILQQLQLQHQHLQQKLQQQQQQFQQQQEQLRQKLQLQQEQFISNGGFQVVSPTPIAVGVPSRPLSPVGINPTAKPFDTFLPPRWREHVINILSRGITKFTLDMDRVIQNSPGAMINDNLLFSPVSLTVTLAMVLLASRGKTFEEVAKILGLESGVDISHHSEAVHQIFGLLLQEAERKRMLNPDLPESKYAFGIFLEGGYPVREEFRAMSERIYKSEVLSLDFSHRNREAQAIVNDWISKRTNGKIKNVLSEPPSPLTNVIITSALYFAGAWDQPFAEGVTQRQPFYVEPDQTVFVDMMANSGVFPYYEDNGLDLKIIGFPYKGNEVTMYAVLPNAPGRAALRQMKSRLNPKVLDGLISKMVNSSCIIRYPRMKLSSTLHLRNALQALGLHSLFDPLTADLSVLSPGIKGPTHHRSAAAAAFQQPTLPNFGATSCHSCRRQSRPIDREFVEYLNSQKVAGFGVDDLRNRAGLSNPGLYADDVIHRVEMTVNERGTEAAAATSMSIDRSGGYKWFIANRPFHFFIRHDPTRIISFWGTINQPTPFFNSMQ